MKNLLFLIALLVAFSAVSFGQQRLVPIATDTIKGAQTKYFAPVYTSTFVGPVEYKGAIVFTYATQDVRDSLASIWLQGSPDGVNYVNITNQTRTTTDGAYSLSQAPPLYMRYRVAATCIAGDTVIFKRVTYLQKQ